MSRDWFWSAPRRKAAQLVAQGELTLDQIAHECGVSDRTIRRWRQEPAFDDYVRELEEESRSEAKRYLGRHALNAARRLVELSATALPADKVRLQATVEVLDRSGVIAARALEIEGKGQPIVAVLPAVAGDDDAVAAT